MKSRIIYFLAVALTIATATSCQQGGMKNVKLQTQNDSASYAIGVLVGANNLKQLEMAPGGSQIDVDIMSSAFQAASTKGETTLTEEEAQTIIQRFFESAGERESQKALEEGNAFLEKNKSRDGVHTTESGLQYEVLTEGTGPKPTAEDQVRVHYHGTTIDGKVFDSSVESGEPVVFGVTQVIPGWTEALQMMPVGSKWKIYLPSNIAYGERGAGADIKPNSALIFEVELLEIIKD